jgi:hypothetical protein
VICAHEEAGLEVNAGSPTPAPLRKIRPVFLKALRDFLPLYKNKNTKRVELCFRAALGGKTSEVRFEWGRGKRSWKERSRKF